MAEKGKDTRQILLNAAREGFAEKGYYGTSMDFIVRKTGLSKGTIYWHFPGKWELYKTVLSEEAERIVSMVLPSDMNDAASSGREFLISRGQRLIDSLAEDTFCRLLFIHLSLEAMRGKTEMIEFMTGLRESMARDLFPLFEALFPGEVLHRRGFSHGAMVDMFTSILHGIILNLEIPLGREEAKKMWNFLIHSLLASLDDEKYEKFTG